jgi:hypothetical protein
MFTKSAAVLSAGRSGSMLVFRNLAVAHYNLKEKSRILGWQSDLSEFNSQRMIVHSHAKIKLDQFTDIRPVFSVRQNIHETLISHYISNWNQQWHLFSQNQLPQRDMITVDFIALQQLIDKHLRWYQWYSPYLTDQSTVVVYEMLVDHLHQPTSAYQEIYPNKHLLIANWAKTQKYLEKSITDEFRQLHGNFTDYVIRPSRGIYRSAAGLA